MVYFTSILAIGWLLWIGYRSYRRARQYHACEVCADRGTPEQEAQSVYQGRWMCPTCINDAIYVEKSNLVQVTVKRKAAACRP